MGGDHSDPPTPVHLSVFPEIESRDADRSVRVSGLGLWDAALVQDGDQTCWEQQIGLLVKLAGLPTPASGGPAGGFWKFLTGCTGVSELGSEQGGVRVHTHYCIHLLLHI